MKSKKVALIIAILTVSVMAVPGCKTHYFRYNYDDANKLLHESKNLQTKPFLKAHHKNGEVSILRDSWQVDTIEHIVSGIGTRYDFNRRQIFNGAISIPIDSVAIFETNKKIINPESGRIAALSILTGVDVIMGLYCVINPKACFGSCPTFYINEDDNFHYSDAEGFTNAIVPSMEYADIDALNNSPSLGKPFSITMKNEALETHCINDIKLLAYPRKKGERIYQSPTDDFYLCENNYSILHAQGSEGDITKLLQYDDRKERFSLADENNLSSKEEVYLDFGDIKTPHNLGLIVNFRQTLMTTYLFYSAMGYMGEKVADVFSRLETDNEIRNKFNATTKELGGIEVYLWSEPRKSWELQNELSETGPIAINKKILPLKNSSSASNVKIKLVMNKGLWRIDYLALTKIKEIVTPVELSPANIMNKGKVDDIALKSILNPEKYLISMPGSEYKFNFNLPDPNIDYELFLYSKGYYLEWMRKNWLKDKDHLKLKQMVENPKNYLKGEVKDYKRYEIIMEQQFWDSKIDTKTFSYHEI